MPGVERLFYRLSIEREKGGDIELVQDLDLDLSRIYLTNKMVPELIATLASMAGYDVTLTPHGRHDDATVTPKRRQDDVTGTPE